MEIGTIINWVRSTGPDGKEVIPMYYCGRWNRDCADGLKGDIKARPVKLGPGEFTATYGPSDFETTDGQPINFDTY